MTGGIILEITYGYQVKGKEDPFIDIVTRAMDDFIDGTQPGKYLVDTFPFCECMLDQNIAS
jgi:hypothetical protein